MKTEVEIYSFGSIKKYRYQNSGWAPVAYMCLDIKFENYLKICFLITIRYMKKKYE